MTEAVSLRDVIAAAQLGRAPLAAESAGYLTLAVADAIVRAPAIVDEAATLLSPDGNVMVSASVRASDVDAEKYVRALLATLLEAASGSTPALRAASRRPAGHGLASVVRELEGALIPVNRGAARRALGRLARETERAGPAIRRPSRPVRPATKHVSAPPVPLQPPPRVAVAAPPSPPPEPTDPSDVVVSPLPPARVLDEPTIPVAAAPVDEVAISEAPSIPVFVGTPLAPEASPVGYVVVQEIAPLEVFPTDAAAVPSVAPADESFATSAYETELRTPSTAAAPIELSAPVALEPSNLPLAPPPAVRDDADVPAPPPLAEMRPPRAPKTARGLVFLLLLGALSAAAFVWVRFPGYFTGHLP